MEVRVDKSTKINLGKCMFIYIDDLIIFSSSLNDHIVDLTKVFETIKTNGLKINLEKCPHILIGGSTGSGKSYLMKCMLSDILRSGEAKVIVLDPKSVDYQFLTNSRNIEFRR